LKIPQHKIDEIASTVDIVDVISGYTNLRKAGKNFMGRCPFHEERTPSFSVSQEKGVYHCFGCGKSGNIFTFLMEKENITFFEAAKELAAKANIAIEFIDEPYDEDRNKIEVLYTIHTRVARKFYDNLNQRSGEYAREYLNRREISGDMITKFGIGYSLKEKDALFRELKEEFSLEDLLGSGLFIDLGRDEIRDRFRGRLMFPIISESGKVIAFGGRKIYDDVTDEAKYINSPETKIYNKSKTLYGLNFSKNAIKQYGFAILVEGYLDLISLFQYGIENVIASSGTSLTGLHVKILSRYTDEIVILFDSDLAGQNASRRAIELILENNIKATVIELPKGEDPDTYIRNNGYEKFNQMLQNRISIIDYIGHRYKASGKLGTPEGNTEFVREIIGLIAKIRDEIKRDFYIKDISQRFSIYESTIRKELENYKKLRGKGLTYEIKQSTYENPDNEYNKKNKVNSELSIIRLLVYGDNKIKEFLSNNLELDALKNQTLVKIVDFLFRNYMENKNISAVSLINAFQDEDSRQLITEAVMDPETVMQTNKYDYDKCLAEMIIDELNLLSISEEMEAITNKIKSQNTYSEDYLKLEKRRQILKSKKMEKEKKIKNAKTILIGRDM